MKSKQLTTLAIVLAVVAVVFLIAKNTRDSNVSKVGGDGFSKSLVIPGLKTEAVSKVQIKSKDQAVELALQDGKWTVSQRDGFPADQKKLYELMVDIADLGILATDNIGESKLNRVGLLDPATGEGKEDDKEGGEDSYATAISLLSGEGNDQLATLWVGKEITKESRSQYGPSKTPVGRYVMDVTRADEKPEVYQVGETFGSLDDPAEDWIEKEFFHAGKVKTIERLSKAAPEENWKLTRELETGDFTLVDPKDGEELDKTKVSSMKSAFASPQFEDVITDATAPDAVTFKIETFEDFAYEVSLSEKSDENEYLISFTVTGNYPKERTKPEGEESEEDAKKAEEDFQTQLKDNQEKLEQEKALEKWVFRARNFVADSINKSRADILADPPEVEDVTPEALRRPDQP